MLKWEMITKACKLSGDEEDDKKNISTQTDKWFF